MDHYGSGRWEQTVNDGSRAFGLTLDKSHVRQFYQYAMELQRWNATTNLTAITEPHEMAIKHFIDSIGPLTWIEPMENVLDIGAGAGFPGIPLKIISSGINLTLIDAVRKKTNFMRHIARLLNLDAVQVIHERIEKFTLTDGMQPFDTILSRAFSNIAQIVQQALPYLSRDGKIVIWKGRFPRQEIDDARFFLQKSSRRMVISTTAYKLPFLDAERTLVVIQSD
jgi:16S rRNA (guanine527-N7)-methyltransferase